MLNEHTMNQLHDMKLHGLADAYAEQRQHARYAQLDFDERFAMLIDRQWRWREERALASRLRSAKFRIQACMEDIDYLGDRKIKRSVMDDLRDGQWIGHHQNVILTGATGTGKSFLACAIGTNACRAGYSVKYFVAAKLFRELRRAHADGSYMRLSSRLEKTSLLIVDDWGMESLKPAEYRDFLEILDDRHGQGATMLTSQFPVNLWHDTIGNPTVADAILDRLVHNAHTIELKGESMRKRSA